MVHYNETQYNESKNINHLIDVECSICFSKFTRRRVIVQAAIRNNKEMFCSTNCKYKNKKTQRVVRLCELCGKEVIRTEREFFKSARIFCSHSCSAKFYNKGKNRKRTLYEECECSYCKKITLKRRRECRNKFCSTDCRIKFNKIYHEKCNISRLQNGKITDRAVIRKTLALLKGYKCSVCGISEWNNKPITLQVDHIDGNCTNNMPDNLQLICPNCHTQTSTYSGRNKGSGRKARGASLS